MLHGIRHDPRRRGRLPSGGRGPTLMGHDRAADRHRHVPVHRHRGLDATRRGARGRLRRAARATRRAHPDRLLGRRCRGRHRGRLVLLRLRDRRRRRRGRDPGPAGDRRGAVDREAPMSRSGSASIPARPSWPPASTWASTSIGRRGSWRPPTAARSSRRRRPAALVSRAVPAGASLRDLGEHRLKDLPAPERLYQVTAEGLDADFPPLRTIDSTPNNLPRLHVGAGRAARPSSSSLRACFVATRVRLVTLTGPGGIGKTRLAVQAGVGRRSSTSTAASSSSIWRRRATPIAVLVAIAQTTGLSVPGDRDLREALAAHLRPTPGPARARQLRTGHGGRR